MITYSAVVSFWITDPKTAGLILRQVGATVNLGGHGEIGIKFDNPIDQELASITPIGHALLQVSLPIGSER